MTAWHPADDNGVDLGSSSYEFKDLYVDGTAYVDGISLAGTITPSSDNSYSLGSSSYEFSNLYVDGTAYLDAISLGGTITPITDDTYSLGSSSYQFDNLYVDGTTNVDAVSLGGNIIPVSDDSYDLGSSSYQFDDLYVDGVANLDAVRTGLIEYNDGDDAITIADGGDMDFNGNVIEDFTASIPTAIEEATTLTASHNGQVLICDSDTDFSLTIPEDTLPKGFNCLIVQIGTGEITLAAASIRVLIKNRNLHVKTANQWAIMTLICIDATTDANVFVSSGDGTS
jgi:hypothetical protein